MIRHSISEATGLLRQRAMVGLALAAALAVPIALGGLTLFLAAWLHPYVQSQTPAEAVNVLLRPQVGAAERAAWIADVTKRHPAWKVQAVPPDELANRLVQWFPYLKGVLTTRGNDLLPDLVEVVAADPAQVSLLARDPKVLAVGPTSSVRRGLQTAGSRIAAGLSGLTLFLLLAAGLLAAVWIHLGMYRHADEITIQRLVGATEAAIRGPFLAVILVTGLVAGVLGVGITVLMVSGVERIAAILGLSHPQLALWIPLLQVATAVLLPLVSSWVALARHSELDLD